MRTHHLAYTPREGTEIVSDRYSVKITDRNFTTGDFTARVCRAGEPDRERVAFTYLAPISAGGDLRTAFASLRLPTAGHLTAVWRAEIEGTSIMVAFDRARGALTLLTGEEQATIIQLLADMTRTVPG